MPATSAGMTRKGASISERALSSVEARQHAGSFEPHRSEFIRIKTEHLEDRGRDLRGCHGRIDGGLFGVRMRHDEGNVYIVLAESALFGDLRAAGVADYPPRAPVHV